MKKIILGVIASNALIGMACTGISLTAKDGSYIQARTIEGAQMDLLGMYVCHHSSRCGVAIVHTY